MADNLFPSRPFAPRSFALRGQTPKTNLTYRCNLARASGSVKPAGQFKTTVMDTLAECSAAVGIRNRPSLLTSKLGWSLPGGRRTAPWGPPLVEICYFSSGVGKLVGHLILRDRVRGGGNPDPQIHRRHDTAVAHGADVRILSGQPLWSLRGRLQNPVVTAYAVGLGVGTLTEAVTGAFGLVFLLPAAARVVK